MPPSRAAKALAIVLLNLLGLLLIECTMRVLWTVHADLTAAPRSSAARSLDPVWFVYSPTLGWERRPGFRGGRGVRREFDDAGYQAIDSRQVADTSRARKRVLFVGDSNTMGYSVGASATFAELIEARLPDVDAINLGAIGYSSLQGRKVVEAYLPRLRPDAVVVSFNHNDRRSVATPDLVDSDLSLRRLAEANGRTVVKVVERFDWSYTARALRVALRRLGAIAPEPAQESGEVNLDSLPLRVNEDSYRENLRRMAIEAHDANVEVVFLLLGDNPVQTHDLTRGIELLEAGNYRLAANYLRSASSREGLRTLGRRYLARTYAAMGETDLAAATLRSGPIAAKLHGQAPARLDSEYHAIMRAVAEEQHAELVDGAAVLDAHPEVFEDACHFDAEGHRLISEALAPHLARVLASAPAR